MEEIKHVSQFQNVSVRPSSRRIGNFNHRHTLSIGVFRLPPRIEIFDQRRDRSKWGVWKLAHVIWMLICLILCGCAPTSIDRSHPVTTDHKSTVAIWDLEDYSFSGSSHPELGNFLSAKMIDAFKAGGYTVLERERLILALQELQLGTTALADTSTRLRIGRLMGTQLMIFGVYQFLEGQMRLDIRMVEVVTGRILKTAQKTTQSSSLSDWLSTATEAAQELMATPATTIERK